MVWLVRLGIGISHSRPRHPQTNGKNERFHRSMKAEVLARSGFRTTDEAQQAFDRWRHIYNHERPHEAIKMQVPIERYRPSQRSFPAVLPPVEDAYSPDDLILVPDTCGRVRAFEYGHRLSHVGRAAHRRTSAPRSRRHLRLVLLSSPAHAGIDARPVRTGLRCPRCPRTSVNHVSSLYSRRRPRNVASVQRRNSRR